MMMGINEWFPFESYFQKSCKAVDVTIINHFRITKECAMLEGNGFNFISLLVVFGIYRATMSLV